VLSTGVSPSFFTKVVIWLVIWVDIWVAIWLVSQAAIALFFVSWPSKLDCLLALSLGSHLGCHLGCLLGYNLGFHLPLLVSVVGWCSGVVIWRFNLIFIWVCKLDSLPKMTCSPF
jgi:hypothetical protein